MSADRAKPFGYNQWVAIDVMNESKTHSIRIENAYLSYGKFYTKDDKDTEILASQISITVIKPGDHYTVYSCGREFSPTGTTGSFDLVDLTSHTGILSVEWDCPWGLTKKNKLTTKPSDPSWSCTTTGFNTKSQALGDGRIVCAYNGK